MWTVILAVRLAPCIDAAIIHSSRDTAGRLTAATYTDGNAHTYSYDPAGNLLQRAHLASGTGSGSLDSDGDGLAGVGPIQSFGRLPDPP